MLSDAAVTVSSLKRLANVEDSLTCQRSTWNQACHLLQADTWPVCEQLQHNSVILKPESTPVETILMRLLTQHRALELTRVGTPYAACEQLVTYHRARLSMGVRQKALHETSTLMPARLMQSLAGMRVDVSRA